PLNLKTELTRRKLRDFFYEGSGRLRSSIEFFGSRMDFTVSDSIVFNENNLITEDISKLEDAFKQLLSFF
ncbi:hypothetical protein S245_046315, partial [Arachis hypogaea]